MIRLFEGRAVAEAYALFRPETSPKVASVVLNYMQSLQKNVSKDKYDVMIDVGCGNGQSTAVFAHCFKRIIAIDASPSQVEIAKKINKFDHIEIAEGTAESLPASDKSVDLIACGQAAHWFNLKKFYAECQRVLKPSGCLVMHGYGKPCISLRDSLIASKLSRADESAMELFDKFYASCKFHPNRKHVDNHYTDVFHSLPSKNKIKDETIKIQKECSLQDFCNYLKTWSGYHAYMDQQQKQMQTSVGKIILNQDILLRFATDLKATWQVESLDDNSVPLRVVWTVFVILSGRPE